MMPLDELEAPRTAATPSVPFFLTMALESFFLGGLKKRLCFAVLQYVNRSDFSAGNNDFNLNFAGVAVAFADISAVFVCSGLDTCANGSKGQCQNDVFDHRCFLLIGQ